MKFLKALLLLLIIGFTAWYIFCFYTKPSLDRNWDKDQAVLATAKFEGDKVTVKNIRNINYRSTTDYDVDYYDKIFDLNKIESLWYMVEPFSGHGFGAAHTLLSFGFSDGSYVAISIEIRKEVGESFSVMKGLLRQYELSYVIADERDVIKLRSNYRKDKVYLYPVKAEKEGIRELFVSMLTRANKLSQDPEFYNTLTSTCTTNIVSHVNEIAPDKIPFSFKILMPGYSDILAQQLGLIDDSMPIEELRAKYEINERAERYADDPNFSQKIREIQ